MSLFYDAAFHTSVTFSTSNLLHTTRRWEGGHLLFCFIPACCATTVLNIDLKNSSNDTKMKCHQFYDIRYCKANLTNINSIFTTPQMAYQLI